MKMRHIFGSALTASLLATGCGEFSNFENREGDIIAGEPVTVLESWHSKRKTGKHGPSGYVLYLVTEDCEGSSLPKPGPEVGKKCETVQHRTTLQTYKDFANGSTINWEDRDGPSEVVEHRYGKEYYYSTVYDFGLLVKQCIKVPGKELEEKCVTDFVDVNFETWSNSNPGDVITFSGDENEVVSG